MRAEARSRPNLPEVPSISIIMCTVGCGDLAKEALASTFLVDIPEGAVVDICVVDNSAEGIARAWVEKAVQNAPLPSAYVREPRPGISHARNTGIASTSGDFVLFIDDDEIADRKWLRSHLAAIQEFQADISVGPVHPVFADGLIPYWGRADVVDRNKNLPTGTRLTNCYTGNTMIRRHTTLIETQPFDPAFGRSGGEDIEFTLRKHRAGRKIIWVQEAIVRESWPPWKSNKAYLLKRWTHHTRVFVRVHAQYEERPHLFLTLEVLKGLIQTTMYGVFFAASALSRRHATGRHLLQLARGLGRLTFWKTSVFYGRPVL